jgi:hypothetical protein
MTKLLFVALLFPTLAFAATSYTVRKGDTLLSIVDSQMGSPGKKDPRRYQWAQRLQALNPHIRNPNALEPGDVITLPPTSQTSKPTPKPEAAPTATAKKPTAILISAPTTAPSVAPTAVATPESEANQPLPSFSSPQQPVEAAPAVASEPAHSAPAQAQPHEGSHSDFIGIQPRFQLLNLKVVEKATKNEAKLNAKSSAGLDLQYGKILSEKAHLLAQVGFTYTEFKAIEGLAGATIDHSQESQKFFALGFAYELTHSLHFDALAVAADRTFIIPTGLTTYELKGVMIPGTEANLSWDFVHGTSYVIGASLIGEYIGALKKDDIEYESALEPVGALYWTSKLGDRQVNYRASLTFKKGHQDTNVSEQKEEAAIAALMVFLPL